MMLAKVQEIVLCRFFIK